MNERINAYLEKHDCANVCCVDEQNYPYCFSCFYAYNGDEKLLYYKSSLHTQHAAIIIKNPNVAGTVLPGKLNWHQVKGLQFEGPVLPKGHPLTNNAAAIYYGKNPAALAMPGEIWAIRLNKVKLTDNSLGFGKKIHWERAAATAEAVL